MCLSNCPIIYREAQTSFRITLSSGGYTACRQYVHWLEHSVLRIYCRTAHSSWRGSQAHFTVSSALRRNKPAILPLVPQSQVFPLVLRSVSLSHRRTRQSL